MYWVPAKNGDAPDGAVKGGKDHASKQYIARAWHEGDLVPGKLVKAFNKCYVSYDGKEHEKENYEVLCDFKGDWVPVGPGENVPYNALPAGHTAGLETLYIGRVQHEDSIQLGKVHPRHGCCFFPYGGEELNYRTYEVLVIQ